MKFSTRSDRTIAWKYFFIATVSSIATMIAFPITVFTVEGLAASQRSSSLSAWDGLSHGSMTALKLSPFVIAAYWLSAPVARFLLSGRHRSLRAVTGSPLSLRSVPICRYWSGLLILTASCGAIAGTGAYMNAAIPYDGWSRSMQEALFFGGVVLLPAYPVVTFLILRRINSRRILLTTGAALAGLAAGTAVSLCFAITPS